MSDLRVIVVEDEPPILRGLCKKLEASGLSLIGTAYDGQEALDLLVKHPDTDIVFTDINMPGMDGLELMARLSREYPHIYVVIISGYEDFNYAREALQNGVYEYLIKPVDPEQLRELVCSLSIKICRKHKENGRDYLNTLLHRQQVKEIVPDCLISSGYQLLQICAGPFPAAENLDWLPGRIVWQKISLEKRLSVYFPSGNTLVLQGRSEAEYQVLLLTERELSEEIDIFFHGFKRISNLPVTLISSPLFTDLHDLYGWSTKLRIALSLNISCFASQTFSFTPSLLRDRSENIKTSAMKNPMEWEHLFSNLTVLNSKGELTQNFLENHILDNLYKMRILGLKSKEIRKSEELKRKAISLCTNYSELEEELRTVINKAKKSLCQNDDQVGEDLVPRIVQYLEENYREKISNRILSEQFSLVPSYISTLFKAKMHKSPLDYLLDIRLQHAKELMKSNSEIKTKDIASLVGFSDPLYFSRVFKNSEGMSPSEYKKSLSK